MDPYGNAAAQEKLAQKQSVGAGRMADTGPVENMLRAIQLKNSALGKLIPEAQAGTGAMSQRLSFVGGLVRAANHEASSDGNAAMLERIAVGGADLAWSRLGGPVAAVDNLTGGHVGGVFRGGAESIVAGTDAFLSGDVDQAQRVSDGILSGKHGKLTQGIGYTGYGIGTGLAKLCGHRAPDKGRAPETIEEQRRSEEILAARGNRGRVFFQDD